MAKINSLQDGTTCLTALIQNGKLTVANLGDSSAILIRNGEVLELSTEQVPSRIDEYQRIVGLKGSVIPINSVMRV
jgi:serine/threonine protein phosphatase PrpC